MNTSLLERLKRNKLKETILYVSSFYIILYVEDIYFWYYTPNLFWCKVSSSELNENILFKIKNESAVFKNFDPELNYTFQNNTSISQIEIPQNPDIGNVFYSLGNQIITYKGYFSFIGSFGESYIKKIQHLTNHDLSNILFFSSTTNTNKYLTDINDIEKYS